MIVRPLAPGEEQQSWDLGLLAFGAPRDTPMSPDRPAGRYVGAFDGDRLVAKATGRPYEQWWCGRPVPMLGVAGVAVHPDARGQGLVPELMDALIQDEPISVLFPTAPGIYRRLGWEVVGVLEDTVVPLPSLPRWGAVRSATTADLPAIQELYDDRGRSGSGLLTRTGPSFPAGTAGLLELDLVSVVEEDGVVTGYLAYDRGKGYRGEAQLRVWDCLAATPTAYQALLGSLGGWDAVAGTALFRGRTDDLQLALSAKVPAASARQPWMLRVLDPAAAVAARGFLSDGSASFALGGATYLLEVLDGRGRLEAASGTAPEITPQGLALLFAGVGRGLHRLGHATEAVPALEQLWAGPPPEVLDYF